MTNLWSGFEVRSKHHHSLEQRDLKQDIYFDCCKREIPLGYLTRGQCRSLEDGAMSCGSTMMRALSVFSIGWITMPLSDTTDTSIDHCDLQAPTSRVRPVGVRVEKQHEKK